jgi:uncharacterized protein (DUF608 family)
MTKHKASHTPHRLFPADLPTLQWTEFHAQGFSKPVPGLIYRSDSELGCGMPVGGIDTGYVDIEANGILGYCTVFNSLFPRRYLNTPSLGIATGGKVRTLTTEKLSGIDCVDDIHYWGHYPVVDLEYEMEGPIDVGLRAWARFLPRDVASSNVP